MSQLFLLRWPSWGAVTLLLLSCASFSVSPSSQVNTPPAVSPSPTFSPVSLPPSPVPSLSPSPLPSPTPGLAEIAATVVALQSPRHEPPLVSPNGNWQAQVVIYDCVEVQAGEAFPGQYAYEALHLITPSGETVVVDEQVVSCGGLGAWGLAAQFWSPSGRYLYYTTAREGAPDGCGFRLRPLMRFDVKTQTREAIGGSLLSPDGRLLASWDFWEGQKVTIWDVDGGPIRHFVLVPQAQPASIAWSPDGTRLAVTQLREMCPPAGPSWVTVFDVLSGEQRVVLEGAEQAFHSVGWADTDTLTLVDENNVEWRYSLTTGELRPLSK